jgi:hypothetical protein
MDDDSFSWESRIFFLYFIFRTPALTNLHLQGAPGADLVEAGGEIDTGVNKVFALDLGHFLYVSIHDVLFSDMPVRSLAGEVKTFQAFQTVQRPMADFFPLHNQEAMPFLRRLGVLEFSAVAPLVIKAVFGGKAVDLGHGEKEPAGFPGGKVSGGSGKDFNGVSRFNRATLKNSNKYPFPGHDTVSGQPINGAPVMTDLADLGNLDQRFRAYPQPGPDGQGRQIQSLGSEVFGEGPGSNLQAQILHLFYAFHSQQADLTVPGAPMGITLQSEIFQEHPVGDIFFGHPFLIANGNSYDFHLFLFPPEFEDHHVGRIRAGDLQTVRVLQPGELSPELQNGVKRKDTVLCPLADGGPHFLEFEGLPYLMAVGTFPGTSNFNDLAPYLVFMAHDEPFLFLDSYKMHLKIVVGPDQMVKHF